MTEINWDEVDFNLQAEREAEEQEHRDTVRRSQELEDSERESKEKAEAEYLENEEMFGVDIARGIGNGVVGAFQSTLGLADMAVEMFGGDLVEDELLEKKVFGEQKTFLGGLANGITQFATVFMGTGIAGAGKLAGKAAAKIFGAGAKGVKLATNLGKGAAADFVAFRGNEENLSNMVEGTFLANPLSAALANTTDEEDSLMGRFRNTVEGLGIGGLFHMASKIKKVKNAVDPIKGQKGFANEADRAAAIKEELDKMNRGRNKDEVFKNIEDVLLHGKKLDLKAARNSAGKPIMSNPENISKAAKKFADIVAENPDDILSHSGIRDIIDTLNLQNIQTADEAKAVWKILDEVLEPEMAKLTKARPHGKELTKAKASLAREVGRAMDDTAEAVGVTIGKIAADEKVMRNLTQRVLQGKIIQTTLTEQTANYASIMKLLDPESAKYIEYHEALVNTLQTTAQLKISLKSLVSEAARATSAGQIKIRGMAAHLDEGAIAAGLLKAGKGMQISDKLLDALRLGDTAEAMDAAIVHDQGWASRTNNFINEYYVNSLLGGVATQTINIVSNAANLIALPMTRTLGGVITGNKQQMLAGVKTVGAYSLALNDSLQMMWKALKLGEPILDQAKRFDGIKQGITSEALGVNGKVAAKMMDGFGHLVRFPTRVLGGADEFFKQMTYRSEMHVMMMEEGIEKGLKNDDLAKFVADKLADSLTDQGRGLNELAMATSRRATFTTPLKNPFMKKVENIANTTPGGRIILPFIRTPVNIITEAASMMPGIQKVMKQNRQALTSGDPRQIAEVTGRVAMGQMLFGGALMLGMNGKLSGAGPRDPVQLAQLKATGWQPYSLMIGDTWVELKRFDPWGSLLGLGADLAEFGDDMEDKDIDDVFGAVAATLSNHSLNKTYLKGLSDAIEAATSPKEKLGRYAQQFASTILPNMARDFLEVEADTTGFFTDGEDTLVRESRNIMDRIMAKIPGTSKSLDPKRDVLGKPVTAMTGPLGGRMSLVKTSVQKPNLVYKTLATMPVAASVPSKTMKGIDLTTYRNTKSGQTAYDRLQEVTGTVKLGGRTLEDALDHLIRSERYQRLEVSDIEGAERSAVIEKTIRRYRAMAKRKLLTEYPQLQEVINGIKEEQRAARSGLRIEEYQKTDAYLAYLERIN